jgi:hypothetical protein
MAYQDTSGEREDQESSGSDDSHNWDLASFAKHHLDEARFNQTVRFRPEDCESIEAFFDSLQTGDALKIGRELAVILELRDSGSSKEMVCLVKSDPRDIRSGDIEIQELRLTKKNIADVQEVIASRENIPRQVLRASVDPVVLSNVNVFMHQGKVGSQFRNAGLGGGPQAISIGLDAESGMVLSVQPDFDATDAVCTTNSFFQPDLPYIESISTSIPLSEEGRTRLYCSVELANWMMKVERMTTIASLF